VDQYWLRIGDVCESDTLVKNSEMNDWLYIIWSTQVNESRQPDYTQLASKVGTCPLTAKLYFFNEATNTWDDMVTAWPAYTTNNNFIATSSDSPTPSAATFDVHFTNPTTAPAIKPFIEWVVKITLEDERADNTCANDLQACTENQAYLEWSFTLQLRDRCADDTITLDTQISSFEYVIASGDSPTKNIAYTQLYGASPYDCDIEAEIFYYDGVTHYDWVKENSVNSMLAWIEAFDTDVGTWHIDTSDRATYGIQTDWNMKTRLYLPDSLMNADQTSIFDTFQVSLKDPCADNQLSM